jgi:hypothetical protein
MRLPFVGERGDYNVYDTICELAQDVDLREGTLQGRWGDVELITGERKRVFVKGDGTVVASTDDGYGFVWGNEVYLINGDGLWKRGGDSGTVLNPASVPPTISQHASFVPYYAPSSATQYSPAPSIFAQNGWNKWAQSASGWQTFSITLSISPAIDLSEFKGLGLAVKLPQAYLGSFRVKMAGVQLPELFRKQIYPDYHIISFDLTAVTNRSSISTVIYEYDADANHDLLVFNWLYELYGVHGKVVYLATIVRNNAESVASAPYEVPVLRDWLYSYGVNITVTGVNSGDVVRLYRSEGENYFLAAQGTASGSSITLLDKGDVGERYVPGGILPYGPAVVWGNRVAIAKGNELYFSAAGNPEKYSQSVLSNLSDPYRVVLPEQIIAVTVVDGVLVAYGRQHAWLWHTGRALYETDDFSSVVPERVESVIPLSAKSVDGKAVAAQDGLYVGGRLIFPKRWQSSAPIVLARGHFIGVVDGSVMYVWRTGQEGWVRYSMPSSSVHWVSWDGQYPIVAGSAGVHRIGAGNVRYVSKWRSGRITAGNKFLLDWLHVYTSQTCRVTVKTDLGDYAEKTFLAPDRWKPTDATYGGRALRWAQIEVNLSQAQKCEAIDIELKPVPLK